MDYKVSLKLRIDWSELDYFAHVNNVAFYKYIQASRVNYWEKIGLVQSHLQTKIGPMLASCKCDFKSELNYPGEITVFCRTNFIGNSSFGFMHEIRNERNVIAATAEDVMVMYDFNTKSKIRFPNELRHKIELLEGKSF